MLRRTVGVVNVNETGMERLLMALAVVACFLGLLLADLAHASEAPPAEVPKTYGAEEARKVAQDPKRWITTSHDKHEVLKQEFTEPEQVIEACLTCHNEAAAQVHKTIHWTWKCPADESGSMGKAGLTFNNFCIGIASNEPRCTSCHAGFGWKDTETFDFSAQNKVDCLVCHDTTGSYEKFPSMAGYPVKEPTKFGGNKTFLPPDYNRIAQNVGRPNRENCGVCHFTGGGGDGVKHGDLDTSLLTPSKDLDVHMNAEGANFSCTRCHTTNAHAIAGRCYKKPASRDRRSLVDDDQIDRIACESCHTLKPHKPGVKANDHTDKVACQACHIPEFARVKPTKMYWDWSTAGKKKDGKPYVVDGPLERHSYDSKKGDFVWDKNVAPEYFFFNGEITYLTLTDQVDPAKGVINVNEPQGSYDDPHSRIYPFKVHRGKQPFDPVNNTFVIPHLFGKDPAAFWKSYEWQPAIVAGMAKMELPFSGEVSFVETAYHYPTTHMVAPAKDSLACESCHAADGRLARLEGFYMPGRDKESSLDVFGWVLVLGSVAGVGAHGMGRIIASRKREE